MRSRPIKFNLLRGLFMDKRLRSDAINEDIMYSCCVEWNDACCSFSLPHRQTDRQIHADRQSLVSFRSYYRAHSVYQVEPKRLCAQFYFHLFSIFHQFRFHALRSMKA